MRKRRNFGGCLKQLNSEFSKINNIKESNKKHIKRTIVNKLYNYM